MSANPETSDAAVKIATKLIATDKPAVAAGMKKVVDKRWPKRLFIYSTVYLTLLFAVLSLDRVF